MIDRKRTACFTGHRNIPTHHRLQLMELLDRMIEALYHKGVVFYGAGGAYGFDMEAENAVLRARDRHSDIRLILVLPCRDQDKYWTAENKAVFEEMLQMADKIVYTEEAYCRGCMHKREQTPCGLQRLLHCIPHRKQRRYCLHGGVCQTEWA